MTDFPIALDSLIGYINALHPEGGALDRLSEAVSVSARLEDQADSLIGHFVDQARRSGASWSEIGASMGVSKQAAEKRFVPRWADTSLESGRLFSRFTPRARNTVLAAHATARAEGKDAIDVRHLVIGLLSEPQAIAALVIHEAGITDEQLEDALGATEVTPAVAPAPDPGRLTFTAEAGTVMETTLRVALSLAHNYIGTEHVLLAILDGESSEAQMLRGLGLTAEAARTKVLARLANLSG
jgi:hypothetical protein